MRSGDPIRADLFIWPDGADLPTALRGSRCEACGDVRFPYVEACVACDAAGPVREVALSDEGRVFEATTVRSPAPGFTAPYDVGYVDLPERLRLFAQLDDGPRAGDAVRIVFRPIREKDGRALIGYAFRRESSE